MMKEFIFLLCVSVICKTSVAQQFSSDSLVPPMDFENIYVQSLSNTNDASSYLIWVKQEVKPHIHKYHTEHVCVIEGFGLMLLGDDTIQIKPKDIISIPPSTVHAVVNSTNEPIKVLSIQSPNFFGKDRYFTPVPDWPPE